MLLDYIYQGMIMCAVDLPHESFNPVTFGGVLKIPLTGTESGLQVRTCCVWFNCYINSVLPCLQCWVMLGGSEARTFLNMVEHPEGRLGKETPVRKQSVYLLTAFKLFMAAKAI